MLPRFTPVRRLQADVHQSPRGLAWALIFFVNGLKVAILTKSRDRKGLTAFPNYAPSVAGMGETINIWQWWCDTGTCPASR